MDGGELPELRHEFGVGVARQAFAIHLLTEMQQLLFGQTAFQIGTGIHARGHVALDVEAVATVVFVFGMPEVVKARTKHVGQRRERADVATQIAPIFRVMTVGFDHHGHGVPAHVGAQAFFNFDVAGAMRFLIGLDGIDVTRGGRERHVDAVLAGVFEQLLQQIVRTLWALCVDDGGQCIHPLTCFLTVCVIVHQRTQIIRLC